MNLDFFKDIDENSFWLTCWGLITTGVIIVVMVVNYNLHLEDVINLEKAKYSYAEEQAEDKLIAKLVEKGHSPLELACLYKDPTAAICGRIADTKLQQVILDKIK